MSECECKHDGTSNWFCERHGILKTKRMVELCRQRGKYWEAWERGTGPRQMEHDRKPRADHVPGPGYFLTRILKRLGIEEEKGCKCKKMATQMDAWGTSGCRKHLGEIVSHMETEASKRRLPVPFKKTLAKLLVLRAIRLSEKAEKGM